ncbi:hypothetical protein BCU76_05075 [Vibrio lentus]|nr:hypothetical protein BCU96_03435 [Vibrio lentus]PMH08719.1 hypothetical protein BCU76_05075 [Vibrio lentus]PMJ14532.1 hypothetical protein BCU30_01525 [Vibrio lentus]PMN19173.1 hypothetical protein BCT39_03085 [Vibrio lentus]
MNCNGGNILKSIKFSIFYVIVILLTGCKSESPEKGLITFVSAEIGELIRIDDGYIFEDNEGIVEVVSDNILVAKKSGSILLNNRNGGELKVDISEEKTIDFFFSRKSLTQEVFFKDYLYDLSVSSVVFSDVEGIVDIEITELNNVDIEVVHSNSSESKIRPFGHQTSVLFPDLGIYNIIIKFNDREFLKVIDVTKIKKYGGDFKIENEADIVEGDIWLPSVTNIGENDSISPVSHEVLTYSINGEYFSYLNYLDQVKSLAPETYIISVSNGKVQSNDSILTVNPLSEWLDLNFSNIILPDKVYSGLTNVIDLKPYKGKGKLSVSIEGIEIFDNKIKVLDKKISNFELTLEIGSHVKSKRISVENGKFRFLDINTSTNVNVERNNSIYGNKFIFSDIKNKNRYWFSLRFINLGDGTYHKLSIYELPIEEDCKFRLGEIDGISISANTINTTNDENGYIDNIIDFVCSSSVNSEIIRVSDSKMLDPNDKFGYSFTQDENTDVTVNLTKFGDYVIESLPLLIVNNFNSERILAFDFEDVSVLSESASKININREGSVVFDSTIQDGSQINIVSNNYPDLNKNISLSLSIIDVNHMDVINDDLFTSLIVSDSYIVDGVRTITSNNVEQVSNLVVPILVSDGTGNVHDISEYTTFQSTSQNLGINVVDKKLVVDTSVSPKTYPVSINGPKGEPLGDFDVDVLDTPINVVTRFRLDSSTGKFGTGKQISIELTDLSGVKFRLPLGEMGDVDSWRFGLEASQRLFSNSGGRILISDSDELDRMGPIGSSYRNNLLIEESLSSHLSDVCSVFEGDAISPILKCISIP